MRSMILQDLLFCKYLPRWALSVLLHFILKTEVKMGQISPEAPLHEQFFLLFLLFFRKHRTESRQELLQVEQSDVGLSSDSVSALIIRCVGDKICNVTAFVWHLATAENSATSMKTGMMVHTRVIRLHEAERSVVDGDGQQTEVVCVAHACGEHTRRISADVCGDRAIDRSDRLGSHHERTPPTSTERSDVLFLLQLWRKTAAKYDKVPWKATINSKFNSFIPISMFFKLFL